jgi:hypothetical protein
MISYQVDISSLTKAIDRFSNETGRDYASSFRRGVGGMVRRAVGVTPPASKAAARLNGERSGSTSLTKDDQERGRNAIARDVLEVFTGIGVQSKRKLAMVELSDAERIHRRLFDRKGAAKKMTLDQPNRYIVSENVLQRLIGKLQKRVGSLAAGFKAGMSAFGQRLPAWVNRHQSQGTASVRMVNFNFQAEINNDAVTPHLQRELQQRIYQGQRYAINSLEREVKAINAKRARQFGESK